MDTKTQAEGEISVAVSDIITQRGLKAISEIEKNADTKNVFTPTFSAQSEQASNSETLAPPQPLTVRSNGIIWKQTIELGYDTCGGKGHVDYRFASSSVSCESIHGNETNSQSTPNKQFDDACLTSYCFNCQISSDDKKLSKCSKCQVASYCSRDCQINDWKANKHKHFCHLYKRAPGTTEATSIISERDACSVREAVLQKVRFYASPFAVHHMSINGIGRGFLFMQSEQTLREMSIYPALVSHDGTRILQSRCLIMYYLTMGEYDQELCRDDFEMASFRKELKDSLETYDEKSQIVYLIKFRCGHVSLCIAPMVPDHGICLALAKDYYANVNAGQASQLNLDDM